MTVPSISSISPSAGVIGSSVTLTGTDFIQTALQHTFDGGDASKYVQSGPGSFIESGGKFIVDVDGVNIATHTLITPIENDFIIDFQGVFNTENGSESNGTISVEIEMSDGSKYGFQLQDVSNMTNFLERAIIFESEVQPLYDSSLSETTINALRVERKDGDLIFSEQVSAGGSFVLISIESILSTTTITKILLVVDKGVSGGATAARPRGIDGIILTDIAAVEFDSVAVIPDSRTSTEYDLIVPSNPVGTYAVDVVNSEGSDGTSYYIEANVSPTGINLSSNYILEGSPNDTIIGYITADDPNLPGDSHNFYLTYSDENRFYINSDELQLADSDAVRYVDAVSHYVGVKAIDINGGEYDSGFYINVGESDSLPAIINSFTGITLDIANEDAQMVNGIDFASGGAPTLYIDGDVVDEINYYSNTYINFNMPEIDHGYHTLKVLNGNNL